MAQEIKEQEIERVIKAQPEEEMLADLDALDKKKHPNKQKQDPTLNETKGKDLVDRAEVLAKVEPALARVRRHDVSMSVREVLALVNGIIADIKSL